MIIATGTSVRHVASTADRLAQEAKQAGFEVFGDEGKAVAELDCSGFRSGNCAFIASRCS